MRNLLSTFFIIGALSRLRQSLATESPFHFPVKALFVLEIFRFLSCLFGHAEKRRQEKKRLISKFMTSQTGKQTIAIHMLSNISRCKSN